MEWERVSPLLMQVGGPDTRRFDTWDLDVDVEKQLTVSLQSIARRNSRSSMFSSDVEIPPTLA